jgi:peptide deformylase
MKLLEIRRFPDPILRVNCFKVEEITSKELALFEDMVYTMKANNGIGLAAPQVGIAKRLIVALDEQGRVIRLANPKILKGKGSDIMVEGCLSLPGESVEIKRWLEVVVIGLDDRNKEVEVKAKGLLARVLQHEIDHLYGKLIIDYRRGE